MFLLSWACTIAQLPLLTTHSWVKSTHFSDDQSSWGNYLFLCLLPGVIYRLWDLKVAPKTLLKGFMSLNSRWMLLSISFPICKMGLITPACLLRGMKWINSRWRKFFKTKKPYHNWRSGEYVLLPPKPDSSEEAMQCFWTRSKFLNCALPLQYFCLGLSKMVIFSQAWNYEPALLVKGHNNLSSYFINSFLHSDILIGAGIINHKHVPQDCIVNVKLDRKL